jgi:hypothetical protein
MIDFVLFALREQGRKVIQFLPLLEKVATKGQPTLWVGSVLISILRIDSPDGLF